MARKNQAELEWERVIRAATAWETVRSSPAYRQDWAANEKHAAWFEALPAEKKTLPALFGDTNSRAPEVLAWRRLHDLGRKWNFTRLRLFLDPDVAVPFIDRRAYAQGKTAIDREWPETKRRYWPLAAAPKLSRTAGKFWVWLQKLYRCPYDFREAHGVFLEWPYRAIVEYDHGLGARQRKAPAIRFAEAERRAGRAVLWASWELSRDAAFEEIMHALKLQWDKARENRKRDPRDVKSRDVLRHFLGEDFLILGVDIRASERAAGKRLGMLLESFPSLPDFEARVERLWSGFSIYRSRFVEGLSKKRAIERWLVSQMGRENARGEIERHRLLRATAGRSGFYLRAERALKDARRFVEQDQYKLFVPPRYDAVSTAAPGSQELPA